MTTTMTPLATERQVAYISSLIDQKNLLSLPGVFDQVNAMDEGEFAAYVEDLKRKAATVTRAKASSMINTLLACPDEVQKSRANDPKPYDTELTSGRYAVEHDGVLKFYKLDRPTSGRWKGYTFLKVQASDDLHRIRGKMAEEVIKLIEADPQRAMERYGQELGMCGRCGRTLTDETSREIGIGPVCRGL
jgi:hypothetical protein